MKLSTIILLWTLNFITTKCDRFEHLEMDFLHTENSIGQQHCTRRRPAYLSGTSAQGAHCSHSMNVFHHNSVKYSSASADMDRTVKCKKPLFDPPHYDGTTSLSQFRQSFNDAAIMNSWETEMEKALWLRNSLKAQARGIIYDNCYNLNELWSRLESRFGDVLKIRQYERLLSTRVRKHNESLTDLADEIRKMALIVYHGINYHAQERLMISCFIRSLSDTDMEYDISQQQPATLDEALLIAQNREVYFNPGNEHSSTLNHICSSTLNHYHNGCDNYSCNSGDCSRLSMDQNKFYPDYELLDNDTAAIYSVNNVTQNQMQQSGICEAINDNTVHSDVPCNHHYNDVLHVDQVNFYPLNEVISASNTACYSSDNGTESYSQPNYNNLNGDSITQQFSADLYSEMGNAMPIPR